MSAERALYRRGPRARRNRGRRSRCTFLIPRSRSPPVDQLQAHPHTFPIIPKRPAPPALRQAQGSAGAWERVAPDEQAAKREQISGCYTAGRDAVVERGGGTVRGKG